jgi:hypothetical protein
MRKWLQCFALSAMLCFKDENEQANEHDKVVIQVKKWPDEIV